MARARLAQGVVDHLARSAPTKTASDRQAVSGFLTQSPPEKPGVARKGMFRFERHTVCMFQRRISVGIAFSRMPHIGQSRREVDMNTSSALLGCLATGLLAAGTAQAAPVAHTLTLTTDQITGTPFGLTSVPGPLQFDFAVDDSILAGTALYDELPGFALLEPLVIGDATFENADIPVLPGGRVTDGQLVEIYLLARYVDPVEGQREIRTYFFPAFQWDGTDFNPEPPSEFMFGTYAITRSASTVPEPGSLVLLVLGLTAAGAARRARR
jgi:hypothetical protein